MVDGQPIELIRDWQSACQYFEHSPPLVSDAQQPTTLRLFDGAILHPTAASDSAKRRKINHPCMFAYAGPALVQLYDMVDGSKPRLLYAVLHKGGAVHNMQWQPSASWPAATGKGMGILALALGSGDVMLLGMPTLDSVQQAASTSQQVPVTKPQCIASLSFYGKCAADEPMVPSSLAWHPRAPHDRLVVGCWNACCVVLQYCPEAPPKDRLQVLQTVMQNHAPVRSVMWAPLTCWDRSAADRRHVDDMFLSGTQDGYLYYWDLRLPDAPRVTIGVTRHSILSCVWPPGFPWPVIGCEDSSVHGISVFDNAFSHKIVKSAIQLGMAVWSVDAVVAKGMQIVAFVGEDGSINMMCAHGDWGAPRKRNIQCIGGLAEPPAPKPPGVDDAAAPDDIDDAEAGATVDDEETVTEGGSEDDMDPRTPGKTPQKKRRASGLAAALPAPPAANALVVYEGFPPEPVAEERLPAGEVAMHRVRLLAKGDAVYLVAAGAAGVVWCQRVL